MSTSAGVMWFGCFAALVSGVVSQAGELDAFYQRPLKRTLSMQLIGGWRSRSPQLAMPFTFSTHPEQPVPFMDYARVALPDVPKFALKTVETKWGFTWRNEEPPFELSGSPICPGVLVRTDMDGLDLFVKARTSRAKATVPKYVAWSSGGKVLVRPADEPLVALGKMDAPWILAWWGDKARTQFGGVGGASDTPCLILVQNPVNSIHIDEDRWRLSFDGKAGSVVVMPLFGLRAVPAAETAKWSNALPDAVLEQVRGWAARMRRVPVDVSTSYKVLADGVQITESFTYQDIDDAWKTPKESWAMLPPIFGLARQMGCPIAVEGDAKDLPWLGVNGALTVVDGSDKATYTIRFPKFQEYVFGQPAEPAQAKGEQAEILLKTLRAEIDKVLAAGHMAPFQFINGKSASHYHYWGNPADTAAVLCEALPFLEPAAAVKLKAYIKKEFADYDPLKVSFEPLEDGARREDYPMALSPQYLSRAASNQTEPLRDKIIGNLYGVSQYVDNIAGKGAAKEFWPRVKQFVQDELAESRLTWDGGETSRLQRFPRVPTPWVNLNGRLKGYIGMARLARLAGDKEGEELALCLAARGLAVEYACMYFHQYAVTHGLEPGLSDQFPPGLFCDDKNYRGYELAGLGTSGLNFGFALYGQRCAYRFLDDLTPEVGEFLHDFCRTPVTATVRMTIHEFPGHWLNRGPTLNLEGDEECYAHPWMAQATFRAEAFVLQEPPDKLLQYVGSSWAKFGDLYYIQRLALALRALDLKDKVN